MVTVQLMLSGCVYVCLNVCAAFTSLHFPIPVCFSATVDHPSSKVHCPAVADLLFSSYDLE